jgi:hypothetical protein
MEESVAKELLTIEQIVSRLIRDGVFTTAILQERATAAALRAERHAAFEATGIKQSQKGCYDPVVSLVQRICRVHKYDGSHRNTDKWKATYRLPELWRLLYKHAKKGRVNPPNQPVFVQESLIPIAEAPVSITDEHAEARGVLLIQIEDTEQLIAGLQMKAQRLRNSLQTLGESGR